MAEFAPGTQIAGYRVDRLIGYGGMGSVYLAEHQVLQVKVALKVLADHLANEQDFRDRFLSESREAVKLRGHTNVIPVFDAGEVGGTLYIAMQYVEGTDLRSVLVEGPLVPERTRSVIMQIADALEAAHALGLVHRDVKPANILIEPGAGPDGTDHCYLADFGLAKRADASARFTRTGMIVGTWQYAAPEQFNPRMLEGQPIDARADIYSLGAVLYECLTGQPPFPEAQSDWDLWNSHLFAPRPSVGAVRPDLAPAVDPIIAMAMAPRRAERYATCGELARATDSALGMERPHIEATRVMPIPTDLGAQAQQPTLPMQPGYGQGAAGESAAQPAQPAVAGPAAAAPTVSAARTSSPSPALTFSHEGPRYILGYSNEYFGLWDKAAPGPPVQRFPRTEAGWEAAWDALVDAELRAAGGPVAAAPTPASTPPEAAQPVAPQPAAPQPAAVAAATPDASAEVVAHPPAASAEVVAHPPAEYLTPEGRVGTVFGPYRILSLLGSGGRSDVYLASRETDTQPVALRILHQDLGTDATFRERFLRETRAVAGISHPNLLPVLDAGEHQGAVFVATAFVDGGSLADELAERAPLADPGTMDIVTKVAAALDAVHAAGIVHRDVQPGNVLVGDSPGRDEHVFLANVGLVRTMTEAGQFTRTGFFAGTVRYLPPEALRGQALDATSDEYGLACVLFECLTGQQPFVRESDAEIMFAHVTEPPPSVTALRGDLPAAIDAVIARGMAKVRGDRYPQCGELAAAARAVLGAPDETPPARGG